MEKPKKTKKAAAKKAVSKKPAVKKAAVKKKTAAKKPLSKGPVFKTRGEMAKFLKHAEQEERKDVGVSLFQDRVKTKELIFAPSTVEARSVIIPTPAFFEQTLTRGYEHLCKKLGVISKFDYSLKVPDVSFFDEVPMKIAVDTREQKQLKFGKSCEIISTKLNFGDYIAMDEEYYHDVFIERKSLNDLIGTMASGYDRFNRELNRAREFGAYIVVLVEAPLSKSLGFNFLPQCKFTKAHPQFIFNRIREVMQKHLHVQFLFVDGRKKAAEYTKKIFLMKDQVRKIDLQHAHDLKLF